MKTKKFKPILFSTEMVQAILAGRKTQTRRIIKNLPNNIDKYRFDGIDAEDGEYYIERIGSNGVPTERYQSIGKPKYQPGDILWVRETFAKPPITAFGVSYIHKAGFDRTMCGWKPSIHMPKEAARIFLKVTNVRVERLQDISHSDAVCEGVEPPNYLTNFINVWQSINAKKHPWESNPWVWVYTFKRIEKPQNFLS